MAYLIQHLLDRWAARTPDSVAIIDPRDTLTYGQLDARARQIAAALRARGVTVGTPVALIFEKTTEAIAALYGVLHSGGAYVPIDPASPATRAAGILASCGIVHVLASSQCADTLLGPMLAHEGCRSVRHVLLADTPAASQRLACAGRELASWQDSPEDDTLHRASPVDLDLAYILHTSGSTGVPKGVAITHRNALAFVDMCVEFFAVSQRDVFCSHAPLHFDLSMFDLFVAAAAGARVVLIPPYYSAFPKKIAEAIDTHGVTIWNSVASALTLLCDRGKLERFSLDSLRAVIFSGEVLPVRVLRAICQRMKRAVFYNVYGQTEANSSMYYRVETVPEDDSARLPIGRAFPNFEVFALGAEGQMLDQPGLQGELYVRASTVAAGYYRDPERSAEKFIADPRDPITGGRVYRTGDLVTLDSDGNYMFAGRADTLIKSRGYRIELGEIELALLACPGVGYAAAVALPDPSIGNRVCAFVSPLPGHILDRAAIVVGCSERLPPYMIPEYLEIRDVLPQTSTGKVDRNALRADILAAADEYS
jgi:amino acid adenylation domain-containing protein